MAKAADIGGGAHEPLPVASRPRQAWAVQRKALTNVGTGTARNGTAPVEVHPVRSEDGLIAVTLPTR